jgi:dTDP-4-dehydrorhamnose reductase
MPDLSGKRILLLGSSGKMGQAIDHALPGNCQIIRHNSSTFDAADFPGVRTLLANCRPDIVINCVAFLGIDPCEREPEKALRLNTLYPKLLAECAAESDFTLVHFSTESVFSDRAEGMYCENDIPLPINLYGFTKYGGDRFVQDLAERHYLFRLPILFGRSNHASQFMEKMLARIKEGERTLRISDDIFVTPGYTPDLAAEVIRIASSATPYGLYHLANSGITSLHGLMSRITSSLGLAVDVECCSHRDFPSVGKKNTCTPLTSIKIPHLRPWQDAADEYCRLLAADWQN